MEKNDNEMNINEVRGYLFDLIFNMSEAETRDLLEELKKRQESKRIDKRRHPRKRTFIHVDCSGKRCIFTDFIQNISASGLYIETQIPLFEKQDLSMTFSPPGIEESIKITGTIVRVDSKGIGVQFDDLIPDV